MVFTLAFLGTDTNYQDSLRFDRTYPRGETLGLLASLIAPEEARPPVINDAVEHLCHGNLHLINGPDTMGKACYDRIRRGLVATLRAIAEGNTDINMFGHSRGGAEAIYCSHELYRIQQLCLTNETLTAEMIADGPLKILLSTQTWTVDQLQNLKQNFAQVQVSMFVLDPVPGDHIAFGRGGWYESQFQQLPPIVTHFEEYVYSHEHSNYFTPIVPKAPDFTPTDLKTTHYKVEVIGGHHGTGSGNPWDQPYAFETQAPPGFNRKATELVQDLVFCKLAYFLVTHGVSFRDEVEGAALMSGAGAIQNTWLAKARQLQENPQAMYRHQILEVYREMIAIKARETWACFDQTNYRFLGQQGGSLFSKPVNPSRHVHYHQEGQFHLRDHLVDLRPDGQLLNQEHIQLELNQLLRQEHSDQLPPLDYIAAIQSSFGDKLESDSELTKFDGMKENLASALTEAIRQPYLAGYYHQTQQQLELINAVQAFILSLAPKVSAGGAGTEETPRTFIYRYLSQQLQNTVHTRMDELFKQLKGAAESTYYLNKVEEFAIQVEVLRQLKEWGEDAGAGAEKAQFEAQVRELILKFMEFLHEENFDLERLQEFLAAKQTQFSDIPEMSILLTHYIDEFADVPAVAEAMLDYHRKNLTEMLQFLKQIQDTRQAVGSLDSRIFSVETIALIEPQALAVVKQYVMHHQLTPEFIKAQGVEDALMTYLLQDPAYFKQSLTLTLQQQQQKIEQFVAQRQSISDVAVWDAQLGQLQRELQQQLQVYQDQMSLATPDQVQQLQQLEQILKYLNFENKVQHHVEYLSQLQGQDLSLLWLHAYVEHLLQEIAKNQQNLLVGTMEATSSSVWQATQAQIATIRAQYPSLSVDVSQYQAQLLRETTAYLRYLQAHTPSEDEVALQKIRICMQLQNALKADGVSMLIKLNEFFMILDEHKGLLSQHRDALWQRFLKYLAVSLPNFVLIAAAITTGLYVGLMVGIGLAIACVCLLASQTLAIKQDNHGSLRFWTSQGQQFVGVTEGVEQALNSRLAS